MSLFSNLFSWAQNSGVLAAAEQQAASQGAKLIQQALSHATSHAPDMSPALEQGANLMMQAMLAGLATKAK